MCIRDRCISDCHAAFCRSCRYRRTAFNHKGIHQGTCKGDIGVRLFAGYFCRLAGICPVSYTHLDVYKRQPRGAADGENGTLGVSRGSGAENCKFDIVQVIHFFLGFNRLNKLCGMPNPNMIPSTMAPATSKVSMPFEEESALSLVKR